ncbi:MAG: hypothetical protein JOZ58_17165 [Acetobacteraceae bacterium]|nr:hypothetical protein [Acetobacteraceae bacterium]
MREIGSFDAKAKFGQLLGWVGARFHTGLNTVSPDPAMIRKGRSYLQGFGYVFKRYDYGL